MPEPDCASRCARKGQREAARRNKSRRGYAGAEGRDVGYGGGWRQDSITRRRASVAMATAARARRSVPR